MASDLTGVTGVALQAALNAASLRQIVGATNIANAGVAGYVPLRVSFEGALAQAIESHQAGSKLSVPQPTIAPDLGFDGLPGGSTVRIDDEAARLTTNAIQYQALLRGLRGQMDILQTVANDGKR